MTFTPSTSRTSETLYLSASAVVELVRRQGFRACLQGIADNIQADFLRWADFDKTARVASHSRDGVIQGLLEKLDADDIPADLRALPPDDGPPRYRAERSFFFRGRYFMEGDQLLLEATPPEVTLQAARIAARGAAGKPFGTVAFFDLDERNLRRHGPRHLQEALAALR